MERAWLCSFSVLYVLLASSLTRGRPGGRFVCTEDALDKSTTALACHDSAFGWMNPLIWRNVVTGLCCC